MAEENKNLKIKKIQLGNNTYDIYATSVDASAINFGPGNQIPEGAISSVPVSAITAINESAISSIPESAITAIPASAISGTDIPWESLSSLAVSSSNMTSTTGIMTPAEIQKAIDAQIATVYKVKGTHTVAKTDIVAGEITNMPEKPENGDVWNIALPSDVSSAKLDDQTITNGDNVVFVVDNKETGAGHWDKLAGSIDTSTMAEKAWVESYVSGGEFTDPSENRTAFSGLWNEVSSYIDTEVTSANATKLWENVEDAITSGINAQVWDKSIQDAETLSSVAADETARATSGEYLVGAGAIVDYVKDQIDSTIQETIDIATYDAATSAFIDSKGGVAPASAVPNAGAVSSFVDHQYIRKSDISYSAETLIIDNIFNP